MTIPNALPGAYSQAPTSPYFEKYILPSINGTDEGGIDGTLPPRLNGARLTSVTAMWQCIVDSRCLSDWRGLAQRHGFESRFFAYVCDEPVKAATPEYWNDWGDCRENSRRARQLWPGVKTMVTAHIQGALDAGRDGWLDVGRDIDILTTPVNRMANRPDNPQAGDQTSAYSDFLSSPGNESWLYTACPQFSCDELEASYFDGWPAYVIDQPASQSRAMGWISYLYGSSGELYHNTTLELDTAWDNQYAFGGNGDRDPLLSGQPVGLPGRTGHRRSTRYSNRINSDEAHPRGSGRLRASACSRRKRPRLTSAFTGRRARRLQPTARCTRTLCHRVRSTRCGAVS